MFRSRSEYGTSDYSSAANAAEATVMTSTTGIECYISTIIRPGFWLLEVNQFKDTQLYTG